MAEFVRRHTFFLTAVLLLAISLQLMGSSLRDRSLPRKGGEVVQTIIAPVEKLHFELTHSLSALWGRYLALVEVSKERDALLLRNKELEAENSRLREYGVENHSLRSLLQFQQQTNLHGVVASVIGRDPSNWARTITINRGLRDGVRIGMPVVDGNAIVGQVIVVTPETSQVMLVTDNASAVDTLIQSSRAPAIAEGTLRTALRLRYVGKEYEVRPGDRVITSGLDGVFPKGLFVGEVSVVQPAKTGLFQVVEVLPAVDPRRIETVMVLTQGVIASTDSKDLSIGEGR